MKELTHKAAEWFNNVETWKSFVELIPLQGEIETVWLEAASEKLRQHFKTIHADCPGWSFREWGASRDTWWYLEDFGAGSVGIGYGWGYHRCFGVADQFGSRIDRDALKAALNQEAYRPLLKAFGGPGQTTPYGHALEIYGDFTFNSDINGHLLPHELAWYAGNETDLFVKQAAAKIEAFACNKEITALLWRLNQELLSGKDQPA